jgi:excisionase family DNA binding protein
MIDNDAALRAPGRSNGEAATAAITEADIVRIIERALTVYGMRHPRPLQVNMKQAAEMLNVSSMTVSRMVRAGTIKLSRTGLIPIEEVDRALAIER